MNPCELDKVLSDNLIERTTGIGQHDTIFCCFFKLHGEHINERRSQSGGRLTCSVDQRNSLELLIKVLSKHLLKKKVLSKHGALLIFKL